MERLKIVFLCVLAAVSYGIAQDQITARVCIEYFTVFHPPIFATRSPTLLAFGWGVLASWWVGLFLGLLLALAARSGARPKLSARDLIRPIANLLAMMACFALVAGMTGYLLASRGLLDGRYWMAIAPVSTSYRRFMAGWFAHLASYATGFLGGLILCLRQYRRRAS